MTPLRQRFIDDLRLRNDARRTMSLSTSDLKWVFFPGRLRHRRARFFFGLSRGASPRWQRPRWRADKRVAALCRKRARAQIHY
jgi:hypothetical protein